MKTARRRSGLRPPEGRARAARRRHRRAGRRLVPPRRLPAGATAASSRSRCSSRWGMDDQAWRLDDTVHPFAMGMSESDIRLTTRFDPDNLRRAPLVPARVRARHLRAPGRRALFPHSAAGRRLVGASTSRRAGCGRTSSGVASRRGASSTRDSRRRSRSSSAAVPLEEFHRALNKRRAGPDPRRRRRGHVLAPHHPALRARTGDARRDGRLRPTCRRRSTRSSASTSESSRANVVEGVLQDVHWSDANFGYFPTYALGNVISIQLWERATGGARRSRRASSSAASSARCASGCARTSTAGVASSSRRSCSSASSAGRSTPSRTSPISARKVEALDSALSSGRQRCARLAAWAGCTSPCSRSLSCWSRPPSGRGSVSGSASTRVGVGSVPGGRRASASSVTTRRTSSRRASSGISPTCRRSTTASAARARSSLS